MSRPEQAGSWKEDQDQEAETEGAASWEDPKGELRVAWQLE